MMVEEEITEIEESEEEDELELEEEEAYLEEEVENIEESERFGDFDTFETTGEPITPSLEFTGQEQEVPELEQQLENTPSFSSDAGQEEPDYALNAPSYESGYDEKKYDEGERREDLRAREMTATIEPTSRIEFAGDIEPRQIDMRTFQRQMQEPEMRKMRDEEDYVVRARQLKEDESLPFQERKKKRELI